jgi:hypothetical protein
MQLWRPIKTRFRFGSVAEQLNLATHHNSLARSTKSTRSLALPLLVSIRFQVLFHSPHGVLFTFPSRYYSLSVTREYLGLGGGPPGFKPGFTCPVLLWCHLTNCSFRLRAFYPLRNDFPVSFVYERIAFLMVHNPGTKGTGLASFPFARRYLGNRCFFLFLRVLRCFSSPGYPRCSYEFTAGYLRITVGEFPHSEICGLTVICTCPQLIAACHVLLRLLVPRHPPYALLRLTFSVFRLFISFRLPSVADFFVSLRNLVIFWFSRFTLKIVVIPSLRKTIS